MKYRAEYSEECGYWIVLNEEKYFALGGFSEKKALEKAKELNAREAIENLQAVKDLEVRMDKIIWIEKGVGEQSTFFTCRKTANDKIRLDEIKEEMKMIADGIEKMVYVGYKKGNKIFEMYAGEGITVMYEIEE